ncbi:MICOS complex subunit Mic60-like isoform X2 [Leptidea sinapis]|uniref:MICOS complex subunit Mic60-like isoform X2 n=1 Tax=Leptidea sinapis TaxID=189913 RepID=UPI0021C27AB7|nr:MICOS complex subunit Mic60-like isoform X2 [Leptidea sinapis]
MFRIPGKILFRSLLNVRRQTVQIQLASLSRLKYTPQERETCPPPPALPPPKPKDDTAIWGALTVLFLAGGFAVIAKRNPELRDWLSIYAPWFDDAIAIFYEENMTYSEFATECIDNMKSFFDGGKGNRSKECSLDGKRVTTVPNKEEILPENSCYENVIESKEEGKPKDVCELRECIQEFANTITKNYCKATNACACYNKVVKDTMENFSVPGVKKLHDMMAKRKETEEECLRDIKEAQAKLDSLIKYLQCEFKAPKEIVDKTENLVNHVQSRIKEALIKYKWENDSALAVDAHWQIVEQAVDKYLFENQTMYPEINYVENQLQLRGDPDLLLYHSYRYSQRLKEQMKEAVENMTDRVERGYQMLPPDKDREAKVKNMYNHMKAALDNQYKQRYQDQRKQNDEALADGLRLQKEKHEENLNRNLIKVEKETTVKLNKMVAEKVAAQKRIFAEELADMSVKLRIVEDNLNAHLKAEREAKRSQELWIAGASLLAATKKGEKIVNVQRELRAIEKAKGDGDKLVETVMKAIPASVMEDGLIPESVLKEKYRRLPGIPREEIEKPPKEPFDGLDTFDKLQRARYWMEHGNIAAAIRYVNSLEGASRLVAISWLNAAVALLETRQAAEAILAHAAALGLQYV